MEVAMAVAMAVDDAVAMVKMARMASLEAVNGALVVLNRRKALQDESKLFVLRKLVTLPGILGEVRELDINSDDAEVEMTLLPMEIGLMTGLTSLDLTGCLDLVSLPESIGKLTGLTTLNLCSCEVLTSLPESIVALTGLTTLNLRFCGSLTSLPESIVALTGLTVLNLEDAENLELRESQVLWNLERWRRVRREEEEDITEKDLIFYPLFHDYHECRVINLHNGDVYPMDEEGEIDMEKPFKGVTISEEVRDEYVAAGLRGDVFLADSDSN